MKQKLNPPKNNNKNNNNKRQTNKIQDIHCFKAFSTRCRDTGGQSGYSWGKDQFWVGPNRAYSDVRRLCPGTRNRFRYTS